MSMCHMICVMHVVVGVRVKHAGSKRMSFKHTLMQAVIIIHIVHAGYYTGAANNL